MLHKIYPSGHPSPPQNTFKLVFLAEGFQANQKKQFHDACQLFIRLFLKTPPFNLTIINPAWINIYAGFEASSQSGAANGAATSGRTVFESSFNPSLKTLSISQPNVNAIIDDPATTLPLGNETLALSDFFDKGPLASSGKSSTLIVLLLPPISAEASTIATENTPGENDYPFVATTTNNFWYQIVLRSLASRLGLGDEYELSGDENLAPTKRNLDAPNFNLQYLDSAPTSNKDPRFKWRQYFSIGEKILPAVVHPRAGDTSVPDNTIDTVPVSYSSIQFWEGGGGYRTEIYRSAKDCLMRRKIGDPALPVSEARVPFCYVCKNYLKSLME